MRKIIPTLDTDYELDSEVEDIAKQLRRIGLEVVIEEYDKNVKFTNIHNDMFSIWEWDEIYDLHWNILMCCLIEELYGTTEEQLN